MSSQPDLSIIVVSYNTRELTLECLRSVYRETADISFEVLVVDNASADGSADAIADEFPQVSLTRLTDNIGFARANNLAAEHARGEYLLLLNPDTVVLDQAIQRLHAFAVSHPQAGIFGGRTLFADRSLNPTSCYGRPTPWSAVSQALGLATVFRDSRWFDPERIGGWARDTVRKVDIVTGCLLMMRRELWERLDGFDSAFFMYAEEADLCLRAREMGISAMICPDATIIHYGGASERVRADKVVRLFRAKVQLFRKHWSPGAARFGVWTLGFWALSRAVVLAPLQLPLPRYRHSFESWWAVWRRRSEWRAPFEPPVATTAGVVPRHAE